MHSSLKTLFIAALATLILAGCSSNGDKQRELELKADRRAGILASSLPIEYGPLTITRASSKGSIVIIEMLYNQSGSKSADQLVASAKNYYCSSEDVRATMEEGIGYLIKVRNNRGQLVVEEMISTKTCSASEEKAAE
ncbi:hypothetical protein BCT04_14665 [Vibrio breoganii]|uniref:GspS/AspS pilotin family protein n=1 Tax=Vibrio breoganii TaxID=553239 RepID=UPI0003089F69|nr:GspS/AspS pilotin family protein [Vibrio breoganii]MDN3715282.1 GspS/AspS pilotin family protein [Vibrio breoganii]OCH74165.1 hypothetical protein A6D95_14550 [Vibrio breoganii]OED94029.1 hypothetical protein A1QG_04580 [Vibrio breoganii ZF-29]OEF84602.1 hypothetical protein B003_06660 [Vibrio breoganii 1C10]PMG06669.1 hypothetical protein BCV00_01720 [Vibrio breoganii]